MAANFRLKKLSKTVVTAARLIHDRRLLLPPVDASVFFCFRGPPGKSGHSFSSVVRVLKKALSRTLGPYNAFPGEMAGNNHGVDFVEAYAGVNLRDLNLHSPDESIQCKLVPALGDGVLAAQVTQLSCGGVVVGCTFDHRVVDGYSANMFWKSWAEMARSIPPSHLFNSHQQPRPSTLGSARFDRLNVPISNFSPQADEDDSALSPPRISRIYSVSSEQINRLEIFANYGNHSYLKPKRTKLEALSAYLWKVIATGIDAKNTSFRLGVAVDGDDELCIPSGEKTTEKLKRMSLNSIADEIHNFVYARESPDLVVMSGNGFPVREMDFGWGAPVFRSCNFQCHAQSGYVMPMASPSGNGDMTVYMQLPKHHIHIIDKTAGHVFKPFSLSF